MVLTDPPYFDFIHYAGLASFFAPWLSLLGLTARQNRKSVAQRSLAGRKECDVSAAKFTRRIAAVFVRAEELMRNGALMVFTYRHSSADGWMSLAEALAQSSLEVIQVIPLPGEARSGLHVSEGSSRWDAVLVLRKQRLNRLSRGIPVAALSRAHALAEKWKSRFVNMEKLQFTTADFDNLRKALVIGAALGMSEPADNDGQAVNWTELRSWLGE